MKKKKTNNPEILHVLLSHRVAESCSPEPKTQSIKNREALDLRDGRYGTDSGKGRVLGFVQSHPTQETVLEEEGSCKAGPSGEQLKCEGTSKRWKTKRSSSICVVEC